MIPTEQAGFLATTSVICSDSRVAEQLGTGMVSAADELRDGAAGFLGSRVHLAEDGGAVVHATWWEGSDAYQAAGVTDPVGRATPGVVSRHTFLGIPLVSIAGPDNGRSPGLLTVATRPVQDAAAAHRLAEMLSRSGEHKRMIPGFVGASAYLSTDGRTFLNYPGWVDRAAFERYMDDPRVQREQGNAADVGNAPASFLMCVVIAETVPRTPSPEVDR